MADSASPCMAMAPVGLFETDLAGRVSYCNARVAEMLAVDAGGLLQRPWPELFANRCSDVEAHHRGWLAAASSGVRFAAELCLEHRLQPRLHLRMEATAIRDASDTKLNEIHYSVAGDANVARSLERNAELALTLSKPDYWLLGELSSNVGAVVEQKFVEAKGKDYGTPTGGIMCSGPLKYDSWEIGKGLKMVPNPDYWDTSMPKPKLDSLTLIPVGDDATLTAGLKTGVLFPNDHDIEVLAPDLPKLTLVVLHFPKWTDGRAYSQARLLRGRLGYRGELRATGGVLQDQIPFMLRCGFDSFESDQPGFGEALARARTLFSVVYQPAEDGRVPASRLRLDHGAPAA